MFKQTTQVRRCSADHPQGISATTPEPRTILAPAAEDGRAREIRELHALAPGLRTADPQRARQAYLEEQLALTERLAAAMAAATGQEQLAGQVVRELQATLGTYSVALGRVEGDMLRTIVGAGPLTEDLGASSSPTSR